MIGLLLESGFSQREVETILNLDMTKSLIEIKGFYQYIKPYSQIETKLSQADFIQFVLQQAEYKKRIQATLKKQLTYPVILFFTAIISLFLFKFILLPSLMTSISSLTNDVNFEFFDFILSILIYFIFILLGIIGIFSFFWNKKIYRIVLFHLFKDRLFFSIQKEYLSIEFVSILYPLLSLGNSTKTCFEAMHQLKDNWLISSLSYQIICELESGNTLDEVISSSILADDLKQFLIIGITTGKLPMLLKQYQKIKMIQFQKNIQRIAKLIQSLSYILITCILFLLYQIIFSPMSILFEL